jgi:pantothenate synthetase
MAAHVASQDLGTLDYVEVADPDTLRPLDIADGRARHFGAIQFSQARLIDNIAVQGGPADPATRRPEAAPT